MNTDPTIDLMNQVIKLLNFVRWVSEHKHYQLNVYEVILKSKELVAEIDAEISNE